MKPPAPFCTISGNGSPSRFVKPGGNTTSAPSDSVRRSSARSRSITSGMQRLIGALAGEVVVGQVHAEHLVDRVEVLGRQLDEQPPQPLRLGVAALQQHDPLTRPILELLGPVERRSRLLVEAVEVAEREVFGGTLLAEVDQVLDQHAERRAPVADVVLTDDVVAEEVEHAHEGVADQRGAQVPDVHLLGDVRRRVVDDHGLGRGDRCDAEAVVAGHLGEMGGEELGSERHVHEARSGDLEFGRDAVECARVEDPLGQLTRVRAELLRERQRPVDLRVGAVGRPHGRVGGFAAVQLGEDRREQVGDRGDGVRHGRPSLPDARRRLTGRSRRGRDLGALRSVSRDSRHRDRSGQRSWRPRQDSNLRTRLRRPMLYPLSYEGRGPEG